MLYLSGWEALNIPRLDGTTADWHPLLYLADKNSIKTYESNEILGDLGIQKRYIKMLDKEEYVANYARAIADLVYSGDTDGLKNCTRDYLDDDEELELFGYLKLINTNKKVDDFMKFELTKLYFKDKKC
ncbi:hypothetical protein CFF98v445_00560 [Campylobacter fetus subsp. fetus]|uniref:Uncharacterized protein n=1 Tax=Campylobacter portucalensis TaxID=2608384 RepID=A0A6L5WI62_9BACT|nr:MULTISPECIES: hypothetical protein [Campylobacter]MSN96900.1 hypothetical protein [Campylobacter portucalensis]OCS17864.1 hypothetical protein CFF98v445_00560 [Campylobacter fetus subsp. fetus]